MRLLQAILLVSLPVSAALSADAKPQRANATADDAAVSMEFLEYLGSLEDADDNWTDFEGLDRKTPEATATRSTKPVGPTSIPKAGGEPAEKRK
ncbi:MAG: hypothetical protein H7Y02_08610 [Candidatus Obscuribacterales bacterium]|nr:hypothetical protein [Steroidobacteraceae bacterium]